MQTQFPPVPADSPAAAQQAGSAADLATQPAAARAVQATKIYGDGDLQVTAVDQVDLDLQAGCFTAIMGPSGSGKSTLMQSMVRSSSATPTCRNSASASSPCCAVIRSASSFKPST